MYVCVSVFFVLQSQERSFFIKTKGLLKAAVISAKNFLNALSKE